MQSTIQIKGLTYRDAAILSEKIQAAIVEGAKALILDMSAVAHMDSAGVGQLVHGYSNAQAKGIPLVLVGAHCLVVETLRLMDLLQFLPLYDTVEQAQAGLLERSGTGD